MKSSAPSSADQERLKNYKPIELGVPANDFQLQQALNYLNGKTIQKAPPVKGVVDGKSTDAKGNDGKAPGATKAQDAGTKAKGDGKSDKAPPDK